MRLLSISAARPLLSALVLAGGTALAPLPVHAADPVNAAPWQAELVSQADGEFRSFYAYRSGPLWIGANGAPNAAATALLELVHTARYDGIDSAMLGGDQLAAAVAALQTDPSPATQARAELALSRAFVAYVKALRDTSSSQMIYEHELLRPYVPEAYTSLEEAASAPALDQYIQRMQWMHPLYAELRQALIATAPTDASVVHVTQANLDRLRALPAKPGERYVLIDAASATLWMYEGDQRVDSMKVVVGKPATQTPVMAGYIRYAVFNPYWNVPANLIQQNIAPRARAQGQAYLKRGGYQVVSDWTADAEVLPSTDIDWRAVVNGELEIKMRQLPSATNSMGKVKYEFPNPQGIYLHDTPEKQLMLKADRQFSNGCIRLEDAARLGRWLLGGATPAVSDAPEQKVDLPAPVPIYVTYLTAATNGEQLAVRGDPYGLDAIGRQALALNAD